ncbi:putative DEAD/DEAH box helicase [Actinoplanes friuliensis DSM 7358]|uniref:Putative DEAD/DEAH box helicase n=2 Tax=Actinoplanes friuliensis TaxID=196914 RepID=U5VP68_9ACTN|nr:putative DEAD/DEAH box helicase [Actinoplanes friuliensis DSM 7358]
MTTFADPSTFPSAFETPAESGEAPRTEAPAVAQETPAAEVEPTETPAVEAETIEATGPVMPTFAELGVPAELVRVLSREGITTPFEIQAATMPDALAGRDVLGRGQTGSGKTLAFGLPLLARVAKGGRALPHQPKALILVPTRELAMQVADALMPLGRSVGVFLKTAVGGVPYDRQMDALRRGVEVIVATPGRLGDLIERGACKLDAVEVTVLDEADQMADMGFLPEVTELLSKTPADAQRLLFSATLDGDVDTLVKRFMNNPVTHSTNPAEASVSTMEHHMLLIPPHDKFPITASIANREGKTIVFARTQMGVDRLVDQLAAVGVRAGALHGGKTQRVRTRTLAEFKEGRTNVLVATDVAARGIHVDGISLVMHVDPPKDPKDYLHRAGRTARAGESGAVVTLVLPKQRRTTASMMMKAGVTPAELRVRLGDEQLANVTGAREPSGVPVKLEPEPRERGDRPRRFGDRPQRGGSSYGDRSRGGSSYGDRPRTGDRDRSFGDRPRSGFGGSGTGGSGGGSYGDRPRTGDRDRSFGDRPRSEQRTYGDRPASDRPTGDRTYADRPSTGGEQRSYGDRSARNFGERPGGFRRESGRNDRRETGNGRYSTGRPAHTH